MRRVRTVLAGVGAQALLLAAVAAGVGLGGRGWAVGLAAGLLANVWLAVELHKAGTPAVGPANLVTLGRAVVVAAVAALVARDAHRLPTAPLVALTVIAMCLDAVDGQVARRTGSVSSVGARFDGEVDAFLILVLSVAVVRSAGSWVLAIGLWRYAFGFAGCLLPWLRRPLPTSYWGKTVAVVQGVTLLVTVSGLLSRDVTTIALVVALVLLSESFCHAIWWLWVQRPRTPTEPSLRRAMAARIATVLAAIVVWAALVTPDRPTNLSWTTFLRVPIEGPALLGIALILPRRPRRFVALVAGVTLALLVVVRALDVGFFSVLDRPFNPVTDWSSLGPALGVLIDSIGRTQAILVAIGLVALLLAVVAVIVIATIQMTRVAVRRPATTAPALVAVGVVWLVLAVAGVTTEGGVPVAARSTAAAASAEVQLVRSGLRDQHTFDTQLASVDTASLASPSSLLSGLRGKDVLLVFIESYGRVAVQDSSFSPQVDALLRAGTSSLKAAGFTSRSAFLTSPTFGGGSWFAHSTVQSGLWISSEARYQQLAASRRFTLSQAFGRAGWRTVFDLPATAGAWPEGERLYHFDSLYDATNVGYRGPRFSFARIPDQYTLQFFDQHELATPGHQPVFAEIVLDSSHGPWAPLPHMVPWQDLGDGTIFEPMAHQGPSPAAVIASSKRARAAYGTSIEYSLTSLIQFLERTDDKNLVVIALGDHQPATIVTGGIVTVDTAGHDVPVTLFARDPRVVEDISSWRWQDGMLPSPDAPEWRMDTFRNRLFAAFGRQSTAVVHAERRRG